MPWNPDGMLFWEAVHDYRFLLDRNYSVTSSLKIVGDRYRLDSSERMILFRGVLDSATSQNNKGRLLPYLPENAELSIDGYNILFTIINYMRGHPVFVSTDGLVRDAGGAHGRISDEEQFLGTLSAMVDALALIKPFHIELFLDAPVSGSYNHAEHIRAMMDKASLSNRIEVLRSADQGLIISTSSILATSDSAILARTGKPVFDLAHHILKSRFGARLPELQFPSAGHI